MVNIGGPYAVKGMMSNPISSPQYWKPSTFGGEVGFNIVKTTTIRQLFCRNMRPGECGHVAFKMPDELEVKASTVLEASPALHYSDSSTGGKFRGSSFSPAAGAGSSRYSAGYRHLPVKELELIDCEASPLESWAAQHSPVNNCRRIHTR